MVNVILHIEFLLRRHDCVIMPGIGAFIRSYRSATFHEDHVTPPGNEICFNSSITNNDGLIVNSVARRENISYEEALQNVTSEIDTIKSSLLRDGELSLGRIGILYLGENSNISFKPFVRADISSLNNGLYSLEFKKNDGVEPLSRENNIAKSNIKSSKYYYIALNKKAVRYAAVLICVLLGAYSLSIPPVHPNIDKASVIPTEITAKNSNKPTSHKSTKPSSRINNNFKYTDSNCTSDSDNYYLIVATFTSHADCEKFISATNTDKFDLKIVSTPSMNRVYASSSSSNEDLQKVLTSQDFKETFSQGGWIWKSPK